MQNDREEALLIGNMLMIREGRAMEARIGQLAAELETTKAALAAEQKSHAATKQDLAFAKSLLPSVEP